MVAAGTGTFYGQAMTAGDIYTIAGDGTAGFAGDGGPATSAELCGSRRGGGRPAGNVVIADTGQRPGPGGRGDDRHVLRPGHDRRATSTPWRAAASSGSPATAARPPPPSWHSRRRSRSTRAGNLVIADTCNDRVRVVAASTGTFYGQAMTAGDIYTIAGDGGDGIAGDGGPATSAEPGLPTGGDGGPLGERAHRRGRHPPGTGGGRGHRHVLRPGNDRRGPVHRRRERAGLAVRQRRRRAATPNWTTPPGSPPTARETSCSSTTTRPGSCRPARARSSAGR